MRACARNFHLGAVEAFLLEKLDGQHSPAEIRKAFETRFESSLAEDELRDFVELARANGFLATDPPQQTDQSAPSPASEREKTQLPPTVNAEFTTAQPSAARRRQSILS